MAKVYFVFGAHNHQPVGNFPEVFEKAYRDSYLPFAQAMERHPRVKWCLHTSGPLWDFYTARHPEYILLIQAMVARGQLEVLSGGYYEPILSAIPDEDKQGQISAMNAFVKRSFGAVPRGMWLAERVWEPHLPRVLAGAGIEYTVLDDAHFAAAGLDPESLRGYYVTEEQDAVVRVFPISQKLRYAIPFHTVESIMEYFRSCARDEGAPCLVMADDGEKFGMWPGTNDHVYAKGWLERFLQALDDNPWIVPVTFSEYLALAQPAGRIYLPTASYFEMSQWSLPADSQQVFDRTVKRLEQDTEARRFLRGGFWRNFLTKYPESNAMHKKMLRVSARVNEALHSRAPGLDAAAATRALYAGQCNCGYWHGVFGGLYLPHIRAAVYQELITADALLARAGLAAGKWERADIDADGREEWLFESAEQNLYVSPHEGGALLEWDILGLRVNMLNVLTRRWEAYHEKLKQHIASAAGSGNRVHTIHDGFSAKEENLDRYLRYDTGRRLTLIDRWHAAGSSGPGMDEMPADLGDFARGPYRVKSHGRSLLMERAGVVQIDGRPVPVTIEKRLTSVPGGFDVRYRLIPGSEAAGTVEFSPEHAFMFTSRSDEDTARIEDCRLWRRRDEPRGVCLSLSLSLPATLRAYPIETVSLSESGFERTYQGTAVATALRVTLVPGAAIEFTCAVRVGACDDD